MDNKEYKLAILLDNEYQKDDEVWRLVENTDKGVKDNRYYISNYGQIYSISNREQPRMLIPTVMDNGYSRYILKAKDKESVNYLAHRLEMEIFNPIGNSSEMQVNHIDGNKQNNRIDNLEWVTCQQNIRHAFDMGLNYHPRGEDNPNAVITNDQAEQACRLIISQQYTNSEIANIIGCKIDSIWRLYSGTEWVYYYNKYELWKYKREQRLGLSDEELHELCKYMENHKTEYKTFSSLYKAAIKAIGKEWRPTLSSSMHSIKYHRTRKDIVDNYNFEVKSSTTIEKADNISETE